MNRKLLTISISVFLSVLGLVAGTVLGPRPIEAGQLSQATKGDQPKPGMELNPLAPVGSTFTYQGRLVLSGSPASGNYDFTFTLFDAATGGNQIGSTITVLTQTLSIGTFTVALDFGSSAFQGDARWLQIGVRPSGDPTFTVLSPRQALTPAPYALSLRPGAVVNGSTNLAMVQAINNGGSAGSGLSGYDPLGTGVTGNSTSGAGISGNSTSGAGVLGSSSAGNGVRGSNNSSTSAAVGALNFGSGPGMIGLSISGDGVQGTSNGAGAGVKGTGTTGYGVYGTTGGANPSAGVYGLSTAANGVGVHGVDNNTGSYGVRGDSFFGYGIYGTGSTGVRGETTASGYGVYGLSPSGYGVFGTTTSGTGVYGSSATGTGIYGTTANGTGVKGNSTGGASSYGVEGTTSAWFGYGVYGHTNSTGGIGVYGTGEVGVEGVDNGHSFAAVLGEAFTSGWAGYFRGDVHVDGSCCGASLATTQIDHPLDPANKYLTQSLVQSPGMLDILRGHVALDANGEATVELPDWFAASNKDFDYQLTCVGGYAPVYIAQEIAGNQFKIAGGKSSLKVSWQVTGSRNDPYAQQHPITVEGEKPAADRGLYLHPELYGQPDTKQEKPRPSTPSTNK
jgi:hypothetical protein